MKKAILVILIVGLSAAFHLVGSVVPNKKTIQAFQAALAPSGSNVPIIYLAPRTDGKAGTGISSNPIDVSTAAKLDSFFAKEVTAAPNPVEFQLAAGQYWTTNGIPMLSGWSLVGSGQGSTVISATPQVGPNDFFTGFALVYSYGNFADAQLQNVQVGNLTLDGSVGATAAPLAQSFTVPAQGHSVIVKVSGNAGYLVAGQNAYVQDMANTNGIQQWWGVFLIKRVNGNHITLENTGSGVSGAVLNTAAVFPASPRTGLFITGTNVSVQSITVQDCASPYYEACCGIFLCDNIGNAAYGNVIENCTTQDMYGHYGCYIAAGSFNNHFATATGSTSAGSATLKVNSTANMTIGYYIAGQGVSVNSMIAAIPSPTTVLLSSAATASGKNVTFTYGIPGAQTTFAQLTVSNNTIKGNGSYNAIGLAGDYNTTITGNYVTNATCGVYCDTGYNTGNVISNNYVQAQSGVFLGEGPPGIFQNTVVSNNTIRMVGTGGSGISIAGDCCNIRVVNNTIIDPSGDTNHHEVSISTMAGTSGNSSTGN